MYKDKVIRKTINYVKERLSSDNSGHDWLHTYRVWQLGKQIAKSEDAHQYVVELGCLLHDIADYKFHKGDETLGPKIATQWLESWHVNSEIVNRVTDTVATVSFKGAKAENKAKTLEAQCVQDADRLDAIGAIGIARCFAFGGYQGNPIYDPKRPPNLDMSEEEYKKSISPQINHFYEKLLLIKDRLNTQSAKKIAEGRHVFMELFLEQFFKELSDVVSNPLS